MSRARPKALVILAAVLTLLLVAYVFAGSSLPNERLPSDRLTDRQAGVAPPQKPTQPAETWAGLPGSEDAPEPPPPPPPARPAQAKMKPDTATPIVPPAPPVREQSKARDLATARAQATARQLAARAQAERQAKRKQAAPVVVASRPMPSAPAQVAAAKPSYSCRYARTRSEVAVCNDAGLASLDQRMAAQFNTAVRQGTQAQREVLERSRSRFLYRRDRCGSAACIAETYRARMAEIDDIAARNWREP